MMFPLISLYIHIYISLYIHMYIHIQIVCVCVCVCFIGNYFSSLFSFILLCKLAFFSITYSNKKWVLSSDFLYIIFPIYNMLIHFKLAYLNILLNAFFSLLNRLCIFTISVLDTSLNFPTTSHNDYSSREYTFFLAFHSL